MNRHLEELALRQTGESQTLHVPHERFTRGEAVMPGPFGLFEMAGEGNDSGRLAKLEGDRRKLGADDCLRVQTGEGIQRNAEPEVSPGGTSAEKIQLHSGLVNGGGPHPLDRRIGIVLRAAGENPDGKKTIEQRMDCSLHDLAPRLLKVRTASSCRCKKRARCARALKFDLDYCFFICLMKSASTPACLSLISSRAERLVRPACRSSRTKSESTPAALSCTSSLVVSLKPASLISLAYSGLIPTARHFRSSSMDRPLN